MSSMMGGGGGGGGGGMGAGGYTQIAGGLIGGAGSILSMLGSQKKKKIRTQSTTTPEFTDQGQALQDVVLRMLFNRLGTTPQSFANYQQMGPHAQLSSGMVLPDERQTLGLGMATIPQGVNPWVVQALQQIGVTPSGNSSVFGPGPGSPGYVPPQR